MDIDFASLSARLLARSREIVPKWLPWGHLNGDDRWLSDDPNAGPGRMCSVNLKSGVWIDLGNQSDGGSELVSLYAALHDLSQFDAAEELSKMHLNVVELVTEVPRGTLGQEPFAPLESYLDEQRLELASALDLPQPTAASGPVTVKDFYAYMPTHTYIFAPTGELWPSTSVNSRCDRPLGPDGNPATVKVPRKGKGGAIVFEDVPCAPATWLDKNHPVEQMTWAPGDPAVIRDRLINNGGWMDRLGCAAFNLYHGPIRKAGNATAAEPWREHLRYLFGEHSEHIERWLAHRVQRPGEKINHALVLGGNQGIGKDSILEPVKYAVGPWNFIEISPSHLLGRFNSFVKSVILRVSEARDLGDVDRFAFYDHTKIYTAAPPDVLRCDEKNLREHSVLNVCGVIITSNHKQDGIYLPADDRRHYVAWSDLNKEEFDVNYWNTLWTWYQSGGIWHVTEYLAHLDLSDFDPKAPPPKTDAFWEIVNANRSSEDAEMSDVLELLNNPPAITLQALESKAEDAFRDWLLDRKNRRQVPHRLETAGYIPVRNASALDGLWKVRGKRKVIYASRNLSTSDRLKAASAVASDHQWVGGAWFDPSR